MPLTGALVRSRSDSMRQTAPSNPHLPYFQEIQVHHRTLAGLAHRYTPTGRLLDVGCGLGYTLAEIQQLNPRLELTGSDIDPVCLDRTRGLVEEAAVIRMRSDRFDLESLGSGYNTVVMSHVLEHLPRPSAAVQGLLEVVRPGGHLILGVPNPMTPLNIVATLFRRHRTNPGHVQTWDRGHWTTFLENHLGAEVVEYTGDEVRVFPGRLKRVGPFRAVQIWLVRLVPWWTFTIFAVLRRAERSD